MFTQLKFNKFQSIVTYSNNYNINYLKTPITSYNLSLNIDQIVFIINIYNFNKFIYLNLYIYK